jgi:hypothetical protein
MKKKGFKKLGSILALVKIKAGFDVRVKIRELRNGVADVKKLFKKGLRLVLC